MGGRVVMLGDSLTAGNGWGQAFPDCRILNLSIGGDTCAGVWNRLDKVAMAKPDLIFLMIGTNDFLRGATVEELRQGHLRIWDELIRDLPKTKLYIQSIPPYMEEALPGLYPNLDLVDVNHFLADEADRRNLVFIDVFSALANEDKQLPPEYTTDGIHLSRAAYRVWEDLLRPYLVC